MPDLVPLGRAASWAGEPGALSDRVGIDHPLLALDLSGRPRLGADDHRRLAATLAQLPVVVLGLDPESPVGRAGRDPGEAGTFDPVDLVDVVTPDLDTLEQVEATVHGCPRASIALAVLLRWAERRGVDEGLAAESAVYSALQAGPEFEEWRSRHHALPTTGDGQAAVRSRREGQVLHVTLCRPEVHNAFNRQMRDELYEALSVAAADPTLRVVLDGAGPSFCSGGDLSEFGCRPDPATAHVVRLQRNVGRLLGALGSRAEAVVHGNCLGSGAELPAFCGRVVARPDARFGLPEIGLGLIPGAGGTVSITGRAGRHAVAFLALSGIMIDATTAVAWGLVDEIAVGPDADSGSAAAGKGTAGNIAGNGTAGNIAGSGIA